MTTVFYYAIAAGLEKETNYPYKGYSSGKCDSHGGNYKIKSYKATLTCQKIVDFLMEDGPVSAAVYSDSNWFSYS